MTRIWVYYGDKANRMCEGLVCGVKEKGIRDSPKVFVLSSWKHGIAKH